MDSALSFEIRSEDPSTRARSGVLSTPRGRIETPVFMPVGTAASVKGLPQEMLETMGAEIILANTYHLYLRPGAEAVAELGGLHQFMSWPRPILTDSGGYQVFSHRELRRIREEGVEFRSHLDGSRHFISPEKSIEIQMQLGSDIAMAFDDCTPFPATRREARDSMQRSMRWAERCLEAHRGQSNQALFGIVQGGMFEDLRRESLETVLRLGFPGVALGGFSVGEPKSVMQDLLESLSPALPRSAPRYLMGVGTPLDLIAAVKQGIDMFDCVLPTRNARNGTLFTAAGKIRIKNARYKTDASPLDPDCGCPVCVRYSRAYLRHLFVCGEILASVYNTCHNVYFYLDLMRRIRRRVENGSLAEFERSFQSRYSESP